MEENLKKLIVNNSDLEKLERKLNSFNPFKVLKINDYEIRHSNIIAWLLNPKENHGFGDGFLKKFIGNIVLDNEDREYKASLLKVYLSNFFDMKIYREYKNIDILGVSEENKIVLLIENKVKSKESKGQLKRYSDFIEKKFKGYEIIKIYLTIQGDEASEESYISMSYHNVLEIIKEILDTNRENLVPNVCEFISYYIEILEEIVLGDTYKINLCKKLYKNNREILEYIRKNKENFDIEDNDNLISNAYYNYQKSIELILKDGISYPYIEAANIFIEENDLNLFGINNRYFIFYNDDILKIKDLSDNMIPILCGFENYPSDKKLRFFIEFQSFGNNVEKRQAILKEIKDTDDFKVHKNALNPESRFSRVYSRTINLKINNEENYLKHMNDIYSESKYMLDKVIEISSKYL